MASPAISVIIPMYNTEKYIEDCLESLLAQTFKNFEVIVVDDCSTDGGVDVVKSFMRQFGGRLRLVTLKKNSGNFGYTARNTGFNLARGEYIFFMDADDMLTTTALEEFYTAAKKFDADVVYTGARYLYTSDKGAELKLDKEGRKWKKKGIEEESTLTVNDNQKLLERLLIIGGVFWTPWTKFVRRKFLAAQDIKFYEIVSGGDYLWTIELFSCVERFVRIPGAVYFWRNDSTTSVTREQRPPDVQINTWDRTFVYLARALNDLSNRRKILKENPAYCYFALKRHMKFCLKSTREARLQFQPEEVYGILSSDFDGKDELDMIIKFFFSYTDHQQKEIERLKGEK